MEAFLARGRVIDLALTVIALELLVFVLARRKLALRGLGLLDLVGQLLAGAFLLLAFRLVLVGAPPAWILLALTASFPAHLYDVARRLRSR
jgi:hypothetical protein